MSNKLKFDDHNANKGTERGKELLDQSVTELGAGRSILSDKNGKVIAGNKTLAAAQKAGLKIRVIPTKRDELVVVQRDDLDLDDVAGEARRMAYLDNRVAELDLEWDPEQVAEDMAQGLNLHDLGFDDGDLLLILGEDEDEEIDAIPQFDKADELQQKWNTQTGQVWQLGNHLLVCGDCTSDEVVRRCLNGSRFQLLNTDPPYGVNIKGGDGGEMTIANDSLRDLPGLLRGSFRLAVKYAEKKAAFYIAAPHGPQFHEFAKAIIEVGMIWKQTLIWSKNHFVMGRSDYQQKHEVFFYGNFGQGRIWNGGRKQASVIGEAKKTISFLSESELQIVFDEEAYIVQGQNMTAYQVEPDVLEVEKPQKNELHPTMKPLKLLRRMIRNSSNPGDIIFEPFSGSGSTILACENEGRVCRAIELMPKYVAVGIQRWVDATGRVPMLLE
jgi:site-specific DNA-methyltransferase (adenine-specific)